MSHAPRRKQRARRPIDTRWAAGQRSHWALRTRIGQRP
jgi:hypothetical protein